MAYGLKSVAVVRISMAQSDLQGYATEAISAVVRQPKVPTSRPAGVSASYFWNGIVDWLSYPFSRASKIDMDVNRIDEGFDQACTNLDSPALVNQFLSHNFKYGTDETPEAEWRKPKDVFASRWTDFPYKGKIKDDCEGAAGFAHYVQMRAKGQTPEQIIAYFQRGIKNNVIFGMYNETEGHATNQIGKDTVCNFGRGTHSGDNPNVMALDFIEAPTWFSYSVFKSSDYEVIEAGDAKFYKTGMSVQEYLTTVSRSQYAVLTPQILGRILERATVKNGELDFDGAGLDFTSDAIRELKQGMHKELRHRTPLRGIIARKVGERVNAVRVA